MKYFSRRRILLLLSGALPLIVYAVTASRTIFLGDNPEFATAGSVLGIAHPSGYPLLVILLKLFSLVPLGPLVWRMNMLSAVAAAAGLALWFLVVDSALELMGGENTAEPPISDTTRELLAFGSCLMLAFSGLFWSQAIIAEAYALNFFFFALLAYLLLRFWQDPKPKYLYIAAFSAGLGLTNHEMLGLLLPFFAIGFLLPSAARPKLRHIVLSVGLFALGLLVYAYLPLRSAQHPALDWGETSKSWSAFADQVLRRQYADYGSIAGFSDKLQFAMSAGLNIATQFGAMTLAALLGLIGLWRGRKRLFFLSAALFLANIAGIILIRSMAYTFESAETYSVYYLPAFGIVALWVAAGLVEVFRFVSKRIKGAPRYAFMLPLLVLVVAGIQLPFNFAMNDLHAFRFLDDYSAQILRSLPANSVLLVSLEGPVNDSFIFSLKYQQAAAHLRPDVSVVSLPQVFSSPDENSIAGIFLIRNLAEQRRQLILYALNSPQLHDRPLYTTFVADGLAQGPASASNGLVYRLLLPGQQAAEQSQAVTLSGSDEGVLRADYVGSDLLAQYFYAQGSLADQQARYDDGQKLFIEAIQTDEDVSGLDNAAFRVLRDRVRKAAK